MGQLRIMGREGDRTVTWDEAKPETITEARRTFTDLKELGYLTYRQDERGARAEVVKTFDPEAKRIVINAPMAGG